MKPLVAVTGPGGRVGRTVLPVWGDRYGVRVLYRRRLPPLPPGAEAIQGEMGDMGALLRLCRGADVLVHLAAEANEAGFMEALLPNNIVGAYNAFEAARQAGVPRVVFASSGQVGGGFAPEREPRRRASAEMQARPVSIYACTKLWGEALGLHYAQRFGMSVLCLRMGWCDDEEVIASSGSGACTYVSGRDLAEAIAVCIEAPADTRTLVSYVVSDNAEAPWDTEPLRRLGWQPRDRLEDILAKRGSDVVE